jgi:hypothetical protein
LFLCTTPCTEIVSVCGHISYLDFDLPPVYLRKLVMLESRETARTETIYVRSDMDILYLSDLFTWNVNALVVEHNFFFLGPKVS